MTPFAEFLNTFFASFDTGVFVFFYSLHQGAGAFLDPFFKAITVFGDHGLFFIFAGLALAFIPKTRRVGITVLMALAVGALITNVWLKEAVARTRPYEMLDIAKRLWEGVGNGPESDLSFPSGHATASFAACVSVFLTCKKKYSWTALVFAFLIALSRIYIGVHYCTDVIAGVLVGTIAGVIAFYGARKLIDVISKAINKKKESKA